MHLPLAILGLTLAGTLNAAALDVRPASEAEITQALIGCWSQEWSHEQRQYEERMENFPYARMPTDARACFEADGSMSLFWAEGNDGMDGGGEFEVLNGKLRLRYSDLGVWIFDVAQLECDVIMSPGAAMKLTNCIGLGEDGGEAIADSSYEFKHD